MLAHTIKPILSLVPEAMPFIKKASLEEDYPLDNADSCIASSLALKYHEVVDHKSVDPFLFEKVASAATLYGVSDTITHLSKSLIKAAHTSIIQSYENPSQEYLTKQAGFEGDRSGMSQPNELSKTACTLFKQASELGIDPSEPVKRYSGHGLLSKQAGVEALAARYHLTGNTDFVKIAGALYRSKVELMKPETILDIANTVSELDKEAGISIKGFDFFKEAILVKSAASALTITLCGNPYPYESIEKLGRSRISQYIGEDVAKEMDAGPMNAKQVFETLPLDLQRILCNLLKNV